MIHHLFIPSVPWRRSALVDLVTSVSLQTVQTPVTFILDGYDPASVAQVKAAALSRGLDFRIKHHTTPQGAGARWLYTLELPDDAIALSLDDDMIIGPNYVEQTLAAWERLRTPLSWCGDKLVDGSYIFPIADQPCDTRLFNVGAGTACIPVSLLRGIEEDSQADRFFGVGGHDEALVSWYLTTKHNVRMWRPAGRPDLTQHSLSSDPRSKWLSHNGENYSRLLRELYARGWPVVDFVGGSPKHIRREMILARARQHYERQAQKLVALRAGRGKKI